MTTWNSLVARVLFSVDDPTGVFHTTVDTYLGEAEMLLVMARALTEKTATFPLTGAPILPIYPTVPDCLSILRVSYGGKVLPPDHLATVSLTDPEWQRTRGEPESWFPVGATHIATYPVWNTGSLTLTYLPTPAAPVLTTASGTVSTATPAIPDPWHLTLHDYARAVALAKESQYQRSVELLKKVAAVLGIRDTRFLADSRQSPEREISQPIVAPGD